MPVETPCYICDLGMIELPSWQQGWWYYRHGSEIVILDDEMIEILGSREAALEGACEALHAERD